MSDHWETEEDVLADWLSMARNATRTLSKPPTRISEHMKKARGPASIYDDEYDQDHDVRYCGPSRGRPLTGHNLRPPGTNVGFRREVWKQIRQVSGLGYSNELIEREFANAADDDKVELKRRGALCEEGSSEVEQSTSFEMNISSVVDFPPLK